VSIKKSLGSIEFTQGPFSRPAHLREIAPDAVGSNHLRPGSALSLEAPMKLIVGELRCREHYVSREFSLIIRELIGRYGWKSMELRELWEDPRPWRDVIRGRFDEEPEVILFWEGYGLINRHARQIQALDCKKVILADDLHWREEPVRWSKLHAYLLCEVVISTYAYRFEELYPEVCNLTRVVWSAHSASADFFLPFDEEAENAVLLSGAVNAAYPLRQKLSALTGAEGDRIVRLPHPGYHFGYDYGRDAAVGPGYARTLNRYRAAFTDGTKYRYTVAKVFEIPATGALLLVDAALRAPLLRLGFVDGEHYLSASAEDLADRVRYVLDESNHPRLDAIRRNGQALVRDRHQTGDRARLIDEVCRPGG
jgi:hypothetical protein